MWIKESVAWKWHWARKYLVSTIASSLFLTWIVVAIATDQWHTGFSARESVSITIHQRNADGEITKTQTITQEPGKTFWDWLSLLGVPITLALLGYFLQRQQQKGAQNASDVQRAIAANEANEEVLQKYFDRLSEIIIQKNLLAIATRVYEAEQADVDHSAKETSSLAERDLLDASLNLIRARTLSVLRRFEDDKAKKSSVLRFLSESKVLSQTKLNLRDANFKAVDLQGIDLSNSILVFSDFGGANLKGAQLSGAKLGGANLSQVDLSGSWLYEADLKCCDLTNANLSGAKLSHAQLQGAKLTGADLSTFWGAVVFSGPVNSSKVVNSHTFINGEPTMLDKVAFCKADLRRANLAGANLVESNFRDVNLSGADLSHAQLSGANMNGSDLSQTDLSYTNFADANLSDIYLNGANFTKSNLKNAIILGTDLRTVVGLTKEQLECGDESPLLCNSPLPNGIEIDGGKDRDCETLCKAVEQGKLIAFETYSGNKQSFEFLRNKSWD